MAENNGGAPPGSCGASGAACGSADEGFWTNRETLVTGLAGLLYGLGILVHFTLPAAWDPAVLVVSPIRLSVSGLLFLGALVVAGYPTARSGLRAVMSFSMSIDFLICVAVLGALVLGKYVEAAALAFLYAVAERMEDYAMQRAEGSLQQLLELSPDTAEVRRNGRRTPVPVEEIEVGETVVVRPGEKIAMDGTVRKGGGPVNQAPVTGESMPVDKAPGDEVYAGTLNGEGYLEIEVTARARDNTLARIIRLVREAEETRAPSQLFVDRFAAYYTPLVVGLAVAVGLGVPFLPGVPGGFSTWWLRAMALLVIACPCGLLISTPVTVVSGITSAARHGTLIKGGEPFEVLGRLDVIGFDKTGTLTEGEPSVSDVVPLDGATEEDVLSVAAALEARSEHPLARAIIEHAERRGVARPDPRDFESITASGVEASVNGDTYRVGKPDLFAADAPEAFGRLERQGKTAVCVGTPSRVIGVIGIADRLRPGARRAVRQLKDLGLEVVMITGDNERTAREVADQLGIDHVHAQLLPQGKVEAVEALRTKYGRIAMVGEGVNDAPALAAADVGIAMGAAGSDTALETSDIALMGDDLGHVAYAVRLSRRGGGIIRQNISSSIGIKLLLAAGVIPGWVTLITAVLIGDMGVTFGITGNALRLRRLTPSGD